MFSLIILILIPWVCASLDHTCVCHLTCPFGYLLQVGVWGIRCFGELNALWREGEGGRIGLRKKLNFIQVPLGHLSRGLWNKPCPSECPASLSHCCGLPLEGHDFWWGSCHGSADESWWLSADCLPPSWKHVLPWRGILVTHFSHLLPSLRHVNFKAKIGLVFPKPVPSSVCLPSGNNSPIQTAHPPIHTTYTRSPLVSPLVS